MFRPPYFGDAEADKPQEVEPAIVAQDSATSWWVSASIRTIGSFPVTADQIVSRTVERVRIRIRRPAARYLLHDSGGDRSATIEALPGLIHDLKARGFSLLPFRTWPDFPRSGDAGDPSQPARFHARGRNCFFFLSTGGWTLQWVFLIGILLWLGSTRLRRFARSWPNGSDRDVGNGCTQEVITCRSFRY